MATEGQTMTGGDYIIHHLHFLQNKPQHSLVDFSVVNIDSVFFSAAIGALVCWLLWLGARKATSGVPGRFQAAVEILVEMVENQAKSIVHNAHSRRMVAPFALTLFLWILAMNAMDLLPVDLLPVIGGWLGLPYLRVVPTADLAISMGLSLGVLLVCLFYNVKIKGAGGWVKELFTAPFGNKFFLWPVNFAMQLVEFASKTISHGMRLFGNMYAGELVFLLIALMGGGFALSGTGIGLMIGHIIAGTIWAIFHILIITIQAFVFMMLALVYVGQAHDAH